MVQLEAEVDLLTGSAKNSPVVGLFPFPGFLNLNFQGFTLVFWQKVGENGVSKWQKC